LPALSVYMSNRLEVLAQKLSEILRKPLASPFHTELVVVQSKGMETWVRMELARHHGVCANLAFPFPNAIVHKIFSEAFGDLPEASLYDPLIMTWSIMGLLWPREEMAGYEEVRLYLGDPPRAPKLYQLCRRIADTFDQYLVFRPEMVLQWDNGKGSHWQASLWRKLTGAQASFHRAALKRDLLERIRDRAIPRASLPQRISIFGISTLPPYHMDIFAALSEMLEVNLFLLAPCKEYWADIVSDREAKKYRKKEKGVLSADRLHLEKGNSLLASMGVLGRDFFSRVMELECDPHEYWQDPDPKDMLSCLQSDILLLRERGREPREKTVVSEEDFSISIHSCHSPMREMEVLQDYLLFLFERYPELEPRDVLVMTADIEAYAPLIQAVFETPEDNGKRIPYRIADRSLRAESQVAETFLAILDLCGSRFRPSEVLPILECPSVHERFAIEEGELPLINRWIAETRMSWGIDGEHRKSMDLPPFHENTWRFTLDRLLLGYVLPGGEERTWQGILPYDHVEGDDADRLGRFAEFLETLFSFVTELSQERTLAEWSRFLNLLLDRFFQPGGETEGEIQMIRQALLDLEDQGARSGFHEKVDREVIKTHLAPQLEQQGLGFGFITGGVTFCAMLPMGSIPFKVLCLVGMDSRSYPRSDRKLGFDLMAQHPKPGDRSRRNDDRYLFLEAILSARKLLYVSYVGQSAQDNSEIPPSALVSELLDYLKQGFIHPEKAITDHVFTAHRLQAFHHQYFRGEKKLFSYSEENLEAARCALKQKIPSKPFIRRDLSKPSAEWKILDLARLARFFENPARFLLKERLGILMERKSTPFHDREAFMLEGLERYRFEQMLVETALSGRDLRESLPVVRSSGLLPHGIPGECFYERVRQEAESFAARIETLTQKPPLEPLRFLFTLQEVKLSGLIQDVHATGLVRYRYARLRARDHLRTWLYHLALNAFGPEGYPQQSILLGKEESWVYLPLREARKILERYLALYMDGLRRPLRFFPESSMKYAHAVIEKAQSEDAALQEARETWNGSDFVVGEGREEYYQICYGDMDPLNEDFQGFAVEIYTPLLGFREKAKHAPFQRP